MQDDVSTPISYCNSVTYRRTQYAVTNKSFKQTMIVAWAQLDILLARR